MYCNFFGFRCRPFEERLDSSFFYASTETEETLASLEYELRYGGGTAVLLGEAGTGKTLLTRVLVTRLHSADQMAVLTCPADGEIDLVREVCKSFGVAIPAGRRRGNRIVRLRRHLLRTRIPDRRAGLIVDQAENLTTKRMIQLTRLMELQQEEIGRLLSVVVVGQPRFQSLLDMPEFARLRQQFIAPRTISPLKHRESIGFIRHRLTIAGAADTDIISEDVGRLVHELSGGIPRLINHYCHAGLVAAYGAGSRRVTKELLMEIAGPQTLSTRSLPASDVLPSSQEARIALEGGRSGMPAKIERSVATGASGPFLPCDVSSGSFLTHGGPMIARPIPSRYDVPINPSEPRVPGTEHAPPAVELESHPNKGLQTLQRLERAAERAEKLASSTESSLSEHARLERILEAMTGSAERAALRLAGETDRAADLIARLAECRPPSTSEAPVAPIVDETRLVKLLEETRRFFDERLQRLGDAEGRAEQVETRLQSFTERLIEKANEVHERMQLLMTGLEAGEDARKRLLETVELASGARAEAESRLAVFRAEMDARVAALHAEAQSGVAALRTEAESRWTALRTDAGRLADDLTRSQSGVLDDALRRFRAQLDEEFERRIKEHRTEVQAVRVAEEETLESVRERLRRELETLQSRYRETTNDAKVAVDQLLVRLSEGVAEADRAGCEHRARMQQSIEETASRAETHRTEFLKTLEDSRQAHARFADSVVEESLRRFHARFEEEQRAHQERADAELRERTRSCDASLADVRGKLVQLAEETARQGALVDRVVVSFKERISLSTAGCERRVQEILNDARRRGDEMMERVGAVESRRETTERAVAALMQEIDAAAPRIQVLQESVVRLTTSGERSVRMAESTQQGVEKFLSESEARLREGESLFDRLEEMHRHLTAQLGGIPAVEERTNALVVACQKAEQAEARVAACGAEAEKTLHRLDASMERARTESQESANRATDARHEIDRAAQQVLTLLSATEVVTKRLDDLISQSRDANDRLSENYPQAERFLAVLGERIVDAGAQSESMSKQCEQAVQLLERLPDLVGVLQEAGKSEESIRQSLKDMKSVQEEMVALVDGAVTNGSTLRELNAVAERGASSQKSLLSQARSVAEAIERHLQDARVCTQDARRVFEQSSAQSQFLETLLTELDARASRAQEMISDAATRTEQVIQTAQSQAAQLEKVCAAVRKVFAGLSQATLEANRTTQQSRETQSAAEQRLSELSSRTETAVETLRAWVEEAIRVHGRLQETLAKCPPLSQTHPGEVLRQVVKSVDPRDHVGGDHERLGSLRELHSPAREAAREEPILRSATRTEEIARLLEEARKAHVAG